MTAVKDQIGKKEENYFQTAKMYLLNDPTQLRNYLMEYKKDNINPKYIEKIDKVCIDHPKFNEKDAYQASKACGYLFNWVKAMYDYYKVYTSTRPLREQLESVKKIVEDKKRELKEKMDALEVIN